MDKEDAREIYALLREIKEDIARLSTENKIDHETIEKVEARIDRVESVLDRAMGAKAVLCLVASAIGAAFVMFFNWLITKGN